MKETIFSEKVERNPQEKCLENSKTFIKILFFIMANLSISGILSNLIINERIIKERNQKEFH